MGNDGDSSEVDKIAPGDAEFVDLAFPEREYVLLADHETMPTVFRSPTGRLDTVARIQRIDGKMALCVQNEVNPIATWVGERGWIAEEGAPPARNDNETKSEPEDLAYGLLSLGWDVAFRLEPVRARVLAKPRSAKIGGSTGRAWDALRVLPGSQIVFIWKRQSPKGEWELDETQSGIGSGQAHVLVDESKAFLLALTIAPDWIMAPELNAAPEWHSSGAAVADTELPKNSYAPPPVPDAEEVAKRKAALRKWMSEEKLDGPFQDRAAVRAFLGGNSRIGQYVLAFRDGGCYIGETEDFNTRFATHEKTYVGDIETFHLRRDDVAARLMSRAKRKHQLRGVERRMIHQAQRKQLHARNFREMANPIQPWPGFVELLDGHDQLAEWFNQPELMNQRDPTPFKSFGINNFGAAKAKFQQYCNVPESQQVSRIIGAYVRRCVPFPARTECDSWSISCLPGAKRGGKGVYKWSVIACLSISRTESLTILREEWSQRAVGFIAVNEIEARLADEGGLVRLLRRHPGVSLGPATHREFGPGTMNLSAASLDALEQLLDDTTVTRAASTSALRLCRLGPSTQRIVHNPFLVDHALRTGRTWA